MKTPTVLTSALVTLAASVTVYGLQAPANAALSDCPSGYICLWTGSQYTGSMRKVSTTGSYQSIGLASVNSYYNHRSRRTWLHATTDGSGTYSCLAPGARSGNVSGWQESAKAVYLSTVTNC
ncbi:MAG: hypothetical protein JWP31_291 [Aeromicrobium sp.]|nr:hypothetical protein [Aeromicrobium sp.]